MARQRHWVNHGSGGDTCFITTTALDFNCIFARPEMRDLMACSIAYVCDKAHVSLNAFVVMPHHVHLLVTLTGDMPVVEFVRRLKVNASKRISPCLTPSELDGFGAQTGLSRHSFWQRSFRSVVVTHPEAFGQKIAYIHENPVRGELCNVAESYRWSSAGLGGEYYESDGGCLRCAELVRHYSRGVSMEIDYRVESLSMTQGDS